MKLCGFLAVTAIIATPVVAQSTLKLEGTLTTQGTLKTEAAKTGVAQLDIAVNGPQIAMALRAPGSDIVGFESSEENAQERADVNAAAAKLAQPLALFTPSQGAGCSVDEASVEHEEHGVKRIKTQNSAEEDADSIARTDFRGQYALTCTDLSALSDITFGYFDTFPNAAWIEVQVISDTGTSSFEVKRESPTLDLSGVL